MIDHIPDVRVLDDFAAEAARLFADWVTGALAERKIANVALAGGTTPKAMYEQLAHDPYRENIAWHRIHFWQGDERPVPANHPDSNWGMACAALLDVVGVPQANRHPMRADAANLDEAAHEYSSLLLDQLECRDGFPVFDLILLGMGTDGHTASLFPGTAGLADKEHVAIANEVPQIGQTRLTLTMPTINTAHEVWFLVTGQPKADMATRILREKDATLPAFHVQPSKGHCRWLMDADSASQLKSG